MKNPLEVVKQQMQAGRESTSLSAFRNIYKYKGMKGYYIGYAPTLLRDILFAATQMPLYEYLKPIIAKPTKR